uniref:Uncharacterized protein n=1 Tax=Varanus komodoensis TaxID=61221 RepID=A0A8D2LGC4_VARKO
ILKVKAGASVGRELSFCIKEFTLERSHFSVWSVQRASGESHSSLLIKEFTLGRSHFSVWSVQRASVRREISLCIKEFTLGRRHSIVWSVQKASVKRQIPLLGSFCWKSDINNHIFHTLDECHNGMATN